ncbi:unnamed protein product [Heterobilharzia americana]|nr:unnamed protein product [Heterobilharzia americana]
MTDSLKLEYVKQSVTQRTFTKLELQVIVLLIVEIFISVVTTFVVLYLFREIVETLIEQFTWSKLVLVLLGIFLGLLLVLVKPFQHRKPLNFFMLFTTVSDEYLDISCKRKHLVSDSVPH